LRETLLRKFFFRKKKISPMRENLFDPPGAYSSLAPEEPVASRKKGIFAKPGNN
jgi:hypothetical protein